MSEQVIDLEIYKALAEMVGDDFILEMVDAFLDEGAQFLSDMDSALTVGDLDKFRRAAHSMKSNAATFGVMELSGLAKTLEEMARNGQLDGADLKLVTLKAAFSVAAQALKDVQNG